ncbi:E3 ubiquitin ligase big brother-related, partial [Thalictrum thalictroides]
MRALVETTERQQVEVRYMNVDNTGIVEENFEIYFPEHGNLSLDEVLQYQESMYLSLQANSGSLRASASAKTASNPTHEQRGGQLQISENLGESSQISHVESQLELDEALAQTLQELENQLGSASLEEISGTETVNDEGNSAETSTQAERQDNVDPDNMTYEELQSLGEVIGTESRGLSEELIAYLPSYKYKTGFFKKEKHEECVICYMEYKNKERLITLPCRHQYHSECVTKWLKLNK